MTTPTTPPTTQFGPDRFRDSETLRATLIRICNTPDGWRTDPEVDELIRYVTDRFTQMAAKLGLEAGDAMSAVFEALRSPAVRYGMDPWGVLVKSVTTTLRAAQFANEALTSVETARRGGLSGCRVDRWCERPQWAWDNERAMVVDFLDDLIGRVDHERAEADGLGDGDEGESAGWADAPLGDRIMAAASLFTRCGWPEAETLVAVKFVRDKLEPPVSRAGLYESLRRSQQWRGSFRLPAPSWTGLLRLLLGNPGEDTTRLGQGIFLRIALGETVAHLAADEELCKAIRAHAPDRMQG